MLNTHLVRGLFFLRIGLPPISTLFPYTTLFRSASLPPGSRRTGWRPELATRRSRTLRDRKSTRLNSSHTVISYAVFCLKKKNKQVHSNDDLPIIATVKDLSAFHGIAACI